SHTVPAACVFPARRCAERSVETVCFSECNSTSTIQRRQGVARAADKMDILEEKPLASHWTLAVSLNLPVRTIPAEHLLELRDVIREKVVEENSLLPIHHAFIWHNIPIFAAH